MFKDQIISSIQNQHMLRISFRKETNGDWVTRVVAPYDIYPQTKKDEYYNNDLLLGYAKGDSLHRSHVISIYLKNMQHVELTGEMFDGEQIKRLINPKLSPTIERNW